MRRRATRLRAFTSINNIPNRTTISLNGAWHYIVDPYETGLKARFYTNAKPKDKNDLVEYDFDKSDVLNVPGDWNTQKKELFFYEGPVWYEKSFSYHKREHTRVFVHLRRRQLLYPRVSERRSAGRARRRVHALQL